MIVELYRGDALLAATQTDADGRIGELSPNALEAGTYRLVFHPPSAFFPVGWSWRSPSTTRTPLPRAVARLALLVRELPRHLTVDELAELFEGRTALAERLAEVEPAGQRRLRDRATPEQDKLEALDAHLHDRCPHGPVGAPASRARDDDPAVLGELTELNRRYEERFGFRFVVFVNRRPKAEIVPRAARAARAQP